MDSYEWLIEQFKTNQFLTGAIGGGIGYSILGYLHQLLTYFASLIKNRFVAHIHIHSANDPELFREFNSFLNKHITQPRNIQFTRESAQVVGIGKHYAKYNLFSFLVIEKSIEGKAQYFIEKIDISFYGLFPRYFSNLFISDFVKASSTIKVGAKYYTVNEWSTEILQTVKPRQLDSVFVPQKIKDNICNAIDKAFNGTEINNKIGKKNISGILLYGPPGTGKTSIIQAMSTKYGANIYLVNLNSFERGYDLVTALSRIPSRSFIVFEDIDCNESTHSREESKNNKLLGYVLSVLDGHSISDNIVVFATTNRIESLDEALIRSGRFDTKEEIKPADKKVATDMAKFFNKTFEDIENISFPVSQAELQSRFI